jgi:hypothetical protein
MLTETELLALAEAESVRKLAASLRLSFNKLEESFKDIIEEDFIALILLAPAVGIALANREISFFEELMLNKKARQLSRNSYFIRKDPVVHATKYLVVHFAEWESKFYQVIALMIEELFKKNNMDKEDLLEQHQLDNEEIILANPALFIKLLQFLFVETEEDFFAIRKVSAYEYKKIMEVGKKLNISELPIFQRFYDTFGVL